MTAVTLLEVREQKSLTVGMRSFTEQIRAWHERNGYDAWLTADALHSCGRGRIQMRLASLLLRGYVERERIPGTTGGPQFLYRYRLTAAGIAALKPEREVERDPQREQLVVRQHSYKCPVSTWEAVGKHNCRPRPACNCGAENQ